MCLAYKQRRGLFERETWIKLVMKYRRCRLLPVAENPKKKDTSPSSFKDCLNHHLIFLAKRKPGQHAKGSPFNFHKLTLRPSTFFTCFFIEKNLAPSFSLFFFSKSTNEEDQTCRGLQVTGYTTIPKNRLRGYATAQHPSDQLSTRSSK